MAGTKSSVSHGSIRASPISWAALIATSLAACVDTPSASLSDADVTPTATAGCIGQTLEICIDSVKRFIPVKSGASGPDFSPDVQGKVPTSASATFNSANFGDRNAVGQLVYSFFVELGANRRIKSLSVSINNGLVALARTEADYEATGIYEAVAAVAKGQCAISKLDFYKSFDAATRGKTRYHTEFDTTTHYTLRDLIGEAKPIEACGLHVGFRSHVMEGADLVSESNLSGTDVSTWLEIR
jgi:hypothetical protein